MSRLSPRVWMPALALLAGIAAGAAAWAQDPAPTPRTCLTLRAIDDALARNHGERLAAEGVLSTGTSRLVIWANPDTGTWTAAVVGASGYACLIAAGEGWEMARAKREERAS